MTPPFPPHEPEEQSAPTEAPPHTPKLRFQRLDVYRLAVQFARESDTIAATLPQGRSYAAGQLRRAALSIVNNIAEGAGEFSPTEKARFYRMALRSGTECAATLDVLRGLGDADRASIQSALAKAERLVAMLTRLVVRMRERAARGPGRGSGAGEPGVGNGNGG